MTTAWNGGECGPIQDRLRQLVASKIHATQHQIAELTTFASELRDGAAALERHRPDGPCDENCGCVSEPVGASDAVPTMHAVSLMAKPGSQGDPAIACTLPVGSVKGWIADWQSLLDHVVSREPVDGGVRCTFDTSVSNVDLIGLVAAEQDCCQFLKFAITVDGRGVALEVRAPDGARDIVDSLFGVAP